MTCLAWRPDGKRNDDAINILFIFIKYILKGSLFYKRKHFSWYILVMVLFLLSRSYCSALTGLGLELRELHLPLPLSAGTKDLLST